MKISCIKHLKDNKSFKIFKTFGMDVFNVEKPEDTDIKIKELIQNNYNTIIVSNELAGFSEDIIKKYKNNSNINIIIAPLK